MKNLFKQKEERNTVVENGFKLNTKNMIRTMLLAMFSLFAFAPVANAMHVMSAVFSTCTPFSEKSVPARSSMARKVLK